MTFITQHGKVGGHPNIRCLDQRVFPHWHVVRAHEAKHTLVDPAIEPYVLQLIKLIMCVSRTQARVSVCVRMYVLSLIHI